MRPLWGHQGTRREIPDMYNPCGIIIVAIDFFFSLMDLMPEASHVYKKKEVLMELYDPFGVEYQMQQ